MKRTTHTAEQIIRKLNTAEQLIAQGKIVAEVCRVIEVKQPTYHRWRQQYGGMQAEEARRSPGWRRRTPGSSRRLLRRSGSCWRRPSWKRLGSCCAVRRTLRRDGRLLSPELRRRAVVVLQER
jgi:hypothetical protein